ncbi:MAG: type IV secretion system DNA-binding domain-containing protein [Rhodospirillales bacterium]|nr:type IV secretion system DNA-binding domain-containing protein [Rhodospirillales bacterium]
MKIRTMMQPCASAAKLRGSGPILLYGTKAQTMLHLIWDAIGRGNGVMVLDIKGDMTAGLPGRPILLAPHDARSWVWTCPALVES